MKRIVPILILLVLVTAGATLFAADSDAPPPAAPQDHSQETACESATGPNLLQNPSFEGEYSAYVPPGGHPDCPSGICQTVQMADGWTPYWLSPTETDDPDIHNPEYKRAETGLEPPRVHDGNYAQQYFTAFSTHEAGFYQRVAVTPGQLYCFSIWTHAWSAPWDDPISLPDHLEQKLGIDPTGGTDWQSATVFWGGRFQQYDEYGLYSLVTEAQADHITVFTWSRAIHPVRHNDVYWDQASLAAVDLELKATPGAILFTAEPGASETLSQTVDIDVGGDPGPTWSVALQPGGTLSPSLDRSEGHFEQDLTVTVDSGNYTAGVFAADLVITTDPELPNSPLTIPLMLLVGEIETTYLPLAAKP